jgi:hypothetical protein
MIFLILLKVTCASATYHPFWLIFGVILSSIQLIASQMAIDIDAADLPFNP